VVASSTILNFIDSSLYRAVIHPAAEIEILSTETKTSAPRRADEDRSSASSREYTTLVLLDDGRPILKIARSRRSGKCPDAPRKI
jgi:hypothetical protein